MVCTSRAHGILLQGASSDNGGSEEALGGGESCTLFFCISLSFHSNPGNFETSKNGTLHAIYHLHHDHLNGRDVKCYRLTFPPAYPTDPPPWINPTSAGLYSGHAYSINDCRKTKHGEVLVQVRLSITTCADMCNPASPFLPFVML